MSFTLTLPYAALVAIASLPIQQQAAQQVSAVELIQTGEDRHQRLTVPVSIGSSGPYEFMVDTGSQHTVLSSGLAKSLGLPLGRRARLTGVAGTEVVDTVELDEIVLGKRSYYGLLAPPCWKGLI